MLNRCEMKHTVFVISIAILIVIISNPTTNFDLNDTQNLPVPVDKIIEGEPVFITSAAGNDYVDSVQAITYGSHSTAPPSGMGQNSGTSTDLTESVYSATSWTNRMTQTTFNSLPSGWTDDNIVYSNGNFGNQDGMTSGYIYCSTVSTTGCDIVRFTINAAFYRLTGCSVRVHFRDCFSNWDDVGSIPPCGSMVDHTYSSTDSQYTHANFRVRISYSSFDGEYDAIVADNWRIDVGDNYNAGTRVDITYRFTGVDYNSYVSERLYVDFDGSTSTEYLDFRFESGDTTPDYLVGNHMRSDFNVDIHSYLTGSECYVNIRDEYQTGDGDTDTWRIDRMYIRLTNSVPQNDQAPVCTNLDYTDNLYARNKIYEFSTSVTDADGYSDLNYVELRSYDYGTTTLRWSVRFDEDTNVFSEISGSSYIGLTGSSYSKSGTNLDVTFKLYIEWAHPDSGDDDLYQYVCDASGGTDSDSYDSNYDYDTRLDLSGYSLSDGSGTADRGNIDGTVVASGTVNYYGTSLHPPSDSVDVWVSAPLNSGAGPWSDTTLDSGAFSMNVNADDVVGLDIYTFKVVPEGSGAGGSNLLESSKTDTYIADQVFCLSITSPSYIVDSAAMGYMDVSLQYAYDASSVISGTYQLGNRWLTYQSGNTWQANHTPNTATYVTYDSISIDSANTHGITEINMDSQSLTMYWEQLVCYIDGPDPATVNIGENATGIHAWAEYSYWSLHGHQYYDGTLNLNNTVFVYDTIGTRGYNVSSANGDDTWGVSTIYFSQSTSCTWVYPDPPPSWNTAPEDQLAEYGFLFSYTLDAAVPSGVSLWWINDTAHFTISQVGLIENATFLERTTFGIQVWVNDTYGRVLTGIFSITVQDTTGPSWVEAPEDQLSEFTEEFRYVLIVEALMGIDHWWLNDTTWLAIDQLGVVTNATFLPVGVYAIRVYVNDTWGRVLTAAFQVSVEDTTGPNLQDIPITLTIELGAMLDIQLPAWDASGISHWTVNDTTNFAITDSGRLFNLTISGPGTYGILVTAFDTYLNTGSANFTIVVLPALAPDWVSEPEDQESEFGDDFSYDLNAEDLSGIGTWWLADSTHFSIDGNGTIAALHALTVGTYNIEVYVSDTLGNTASAEFSVTVSDTTAPAWIVVPQDVELSYGETVGIQLSASDLSGISAWTITSSSDFEINGTGYITHDGLLGSGTYTLDVTVIDSYGNEQIATFTVTVAESSDIMGIPITVILIIGGVVIVIVIVIGRKIILNRGA